MLPGRVPYPRPTRPDNTERTAADVDSGTYYRDNYEDRIGLTTAKRFWKCNGCGREGSVFEGLDEALETRRMMVGLEESLPEEFADGKPPSGRDGL
jgi:hypothetical protein